MVSRIMPSCALIEGTLESGHIYFLYRPKIDTEDVDSIDDISKLVSSGAITLTMFPRSTQLMADSISS